MTQLIHGSATLTMDKFIYPFLLDWMHIQIVYYQDSFLQFIICTYHNNLFINLLADMFCLVTTAVVNRLQSKKYWRWPISQNVHGRELKTNCWYMSNIVKYKKSSWNVLELRRQIKWSLCINVLLRKHETRNKSPTSLNSACNGGGGSLASTTVVLSWGKCPFAHWTGGWWTLEKVCMWWQREIYIEVSVYTCKICPPLNVLLC
jgi:hypothetical protein